MRNQPARHTLTSEQQSAFDEIEKIIDTNKPVAATLSGFAGAGKAQPVSEPVYTPSGKTTMGNLSVGDFVIGKSGKPTKVEGIYPQGEKEVYSVSFDDKTSVKCCKEHLWQVETCNDRNVTRSRKRGGYKNGKRSFSILSVEEMIEKGIRKESRNRWRYRVPVISNPVKFSEKELVVDPYLMGIIISEGSLTSKTTRFCSGDEFVVSECKKIVDKSFDELEVVFHDGVSYSIAGTRGKENVVTRELRKIGLDKKRSYEKFIPNKYLYNTEKNRISLLQGLMDGDGWVRKNGNHIRYSTSSETLAGDFCELVRSLGCVAKLNEKETTHRTSYRITVNQPKELNLFRLPRKKNRVVEKTKYAQRKYITNISKTGKFEEQVCIKVSSSDSLYLTKGFTPTHNTVLLRHLVRRLGPTFSQTVLMAPTHKAAEVLGRKTDMSVSTVHSVLGLRPEPDGEGGYNFVQSHGGMKAFAPNSLLAVDEASMVPQELYDKLMGVQQQFNLSIIFCGDPAQLPPVNENPSPALEHDGYKLETIVRQEKDNPIIQTSMEVRESEDAKRYNFTTNVSGEQGVEVVSSKKDLVYRALQAFDTDEYRKQGDYARILAYRNDEVEKYNKLCRSMLYEDAEEQFIEGEWLVATDPWYGDKGRRDTPVIQNSEEFVVEGKEPSKLYGFNTWILEISPSPDSEKVKHIEVLNRDELGRYENKLNELAEKAKKTNDWEKYYDYKEHFAHVDYSFAMTSHKSQGSTFTKTFVDIEDINACPNPSEIQRLKYVAVTRASKRLVVFDS